MKERPILFSAPMVRAILEGTKSQTRRRIKDCFAYEYDDNDPWPEAADEDGVWRRLRCPYGDVGDLLWLRETCRAEELTTELAAEYDKLPGQDGVRYLADGAWRTIENSMAASERWVALHNYGKRRGATVPPIHMPRWASRITLQITDLRVERLNDINREDVAAEGVELPRCEKCGYTRGDCLIHMDHHLCGQETPVHEVSAYRALWETINGAGSWDRNPWVWVVSFERIAPTSTAERS